MKNERRKNKMILVFAVEFLILFCLVLSAQAIDMGAIRSGETRTGNDIYFGEDVIVPLEKVGENLTSPEMPFPEMEWGKIYYWRVEAHISNGTIQGPYWWFKTKAVNQPPIANFCYSPSQPIVNETITFNASESYDSDGGNITKYEWGFGDGNITNITEPIITHFFTFAKEYTVNLTVTDDEGLTNSTTKVIHIVPVKAITTISVRSLPEVPGGENFTATVNVDNVSNLAILMFKLTYDPSVIELTEVERGSDILDWSHWNSLWELSTGTVKIFAFSDPSGSPINGSADLTRLEFEVVGEAGNKSIIDIRGIIANSDVEPIEGIWVGSEVIVTPIETLTKANKR